MLGNLIKTLSAGRSAVAAAVDGVDLIREQIFAAKKEIDRIASAPQPVEAALAAFDSWAGRVATEAVDAMSVGSLLDPRSARRGFPLPRMALPVGSAGEAVFDYGAATDRLLGLLVATSMSALRQIIEGQLDDLTFGKETMTEAVRAKKLANAEAELLTHELTEESAIRALENAGVDILRRPDADPRALLAVDASLPS